MSSSAQDFALYYQSWKNRITLRWVDFAKKRVLKRVFRSQPRSRIADLGSGTGAVSAVLLGKHDVWAVDANAQLLGVAEGRGMKTIKSIFDDVPVVAGFFDAVVMVDSIEHVRCRKQLLAEINRIAKPGSIIVLITPNYGSLLWNVGEAVGKFISGKLSGHISPFTAESLRFFLDQVSTDVELGKLNFGMWLWAKARLRSYADWVGQ